MEAIYRCKFILIRTSVRFLFSFILPVLLRKKLVFSLNWNILLWVGYLFRFVVIGCFGYEEVYFGLGYSLLQQLKAVRSFLCQWFFNDLFWICTSIWMNYWSTGILSFHQGSITHRLRYQRIIPLTIFPLSFSIYLWHINWKVVLSNNKIVRIGIWERKLLRLTAKNNQISAGFATKQTIESQSHQQKEQF